MAQQQKRKGKEYLDDFHKDLNGNYQYTGAYDRYCGAMPRKKAMALLWLLCGGAFAALAVAGFVPAPGAMNRFYVLLPYMVALVVQISAVWALVRLTAGGDPLRRYVREQTVDKMPLRCGVSAAAAVVAAAGECVDLFSHGVQNALAPALGFLLLALAGGAASGAAAVLAGRMKYSDASVEKD